MIFGDTHISLQSSIGYVNGNLHAKSSLIRQSVSTEHRLATDTDRYRATGTANTALAKRTVVLKTVIAFVLKIYKVAVCLKCQSN